MLKSRTALEELLSEVFLLRVSKVFVFSLVSSGEFPESVKINETVDFVGGKPHLAKSHLMLPSLFHKCPLQATSTTTLSSMMLTLRAPALMRATTLTEFSHFYLLSRPDGFNLDE